MKTKALRYIDPRLTALAIKPLLDDTKTDKDLKDWLFKKIAKICAVPRKNLKKKGGKP